MTDWDRQATKQIVMKADRCTFCEQPLEEVADVSKSLGRQYVGSELQADYITMSVRRLPDQEALGL